MFRFLVNLNELSWILIVCLLGSACQRQPKPTPGHTASIAWGNLEPKQDGRFFHKNAPFNGVAVRKYEDGRKQEEAHFRDGLPHGKHLRWHVDGWKQMEMHYVAGVAEGEWTQWQADGLVVRVEVWRSGKSTGIRYGEHITKEVEQKETKRAVPPLPPMRAERKDG